MDHRQLVIRMSVEDYDMLTLAADKVGMPTSTYGRYLIMLAIKADAEAHAKTQAKEQARIDKEKAKKEREYERIHQAMHMQLVRTNKQAERELAKKHREGALAAGRARRAAAKEEREFVAKAKRMAKQRIKFGWKDDE